jgi:hypothetical protein
MESGDAGRRPSRRPIDGHGSGYIGRAVPVVSREILVRVCYGVAEERIVPLERPRDRLGVGVEEKLGRIEAMPVLGLVRAVDAVAIGKSRSRLGQGRRATPDWCAPACGCGGAPASDPLDRRGKGRRPSACSLKRAKFTPAPSHVAPSGYGAPGRVRGSFPERSGLMGSPPA